MFIQFWVATASFQLQCETDNLFTSGALAPSTRLALPLAELALSLSLALVGLWPSPNHSWVSLPLSCLCSCSCELSRTRPSCVWPSALNEYQHRALSRFFGHNQRERRRERARERKLVERRDWGRETGVGGGSSCCGCAYLLPCYGLLLPRWSFTPVGRSIEHTHTHTHLRHVQPCCVCASVCVLALLAFWLARPWYLSTVHGPSPGSSSVQISQRLSLGSAKASSSSSSSRSSWWWS